jgi:hypothetical protein
MSSHEEISTGLLRGLGHSMLMMIVLLPWFISAELFGSCLFFKEVEDFGGAALTLLSSPTLLQSTHLLCVHPKLPPVLNCIKHLTIIIVNIYINIIKILA